ncbi:hypothetical protein MKW98_007385 [Papaver atlanticum]|uniref:Origin recognition complex subunit 1 n=1 Tax=Papaver atlanticum TaxID=357466 RepID=A0AAD4SDP4_9MAGN|nr:hypothetical protein MKW98_007385 [Papaver atlanticum]
MVSKKPTEKKSKRRDGPKKRVYYKKVVYDGGEFDIGDDVYVKRREDANSDNDDPEVEECIFCFKSGRNLMIECDHCLGGFHLKCLRPPLKEIPDGDWICEFCEARKTGKKVELPEPPKGKKRRRTAREKLLSSDLWAVHIESLWKEPDGSYWFKGRWYVIPEETAVGRQPHNLRREIYLTNDFTDIEMESIVRYCSVMNCKEFSEANNEGDDVFLCEYEYDIQWRSFKRLADIDNEEIDSISDPEENLKSARKKLKFSASGQSPGHGFAANAQGGNFFGLHKIGTKKILEHVKGHKQTEIEKAKSTLLLATLPKSPPCRNKEMEEIAEFVKDAVSINQCLGRCLYIHGVPGTGKTMSVLAAMRNLRSEVDAENIYRVIYEKLSGHRVSWKKALSLLNERFSNDNKVCNSQPCVLLIDELDLLVTRNQSVLYNILDWPTKPHSKLVVIGIANTMDLPEKLLPRISSRMGIQRLCFSPYTYQQLREIISSRIEGIEAFDKQAIKFAWVAAISGDARRALEICRRASEIADYKIKKSSSTLGFSSAGKNHVGMADVEAAIQEMFQTPHIQIIKSCSNLSKIFLVALEHELYKSGMGETTFEKLAANVFSLCGSNKEEFPGYDTLLKIGCKLGECRIIICEAGARHRLQKLQLNFPRFLFVIT